MPPLIGDPVCRRITHREEIKESWQPTSHKEREAIAHDVAIGHEENADVCTCEFGERALVGTPSWICREHRCYAYEIGRCEEPGSQYPGDRELRLHVDGVGRWEEDCGLLYQGSRRSRGATRQSRSEPM